MAEFAAGAGDRGVLLVLQLFDSMENPSPGTADLIMCGQAVLGDDNLFVVPLGNHPPHYVLGKAYGDVFTLRVGRRVRTTYAAVLMTLPQDGHSIAGDCR